MTRLAGGYAVICPDGLNRLKTNWETLEEAQFDAQYFNVIERSCWTWCSDQQFKHPHGDVCPGGIHTVRPRDTKEPELELAWSTGWEPDDPFTSLVSWREKRKKVIPCSSVTIAPPSTTGPKASPGATARAKSAERSARAPTYIAVRCRCPASR